MFLTAALGVLLTLPSSGPGHDTTARSPRHATPVKPPPIPRPISGSVPVDPVPNTEDPVTGLPLSGGVRYRWTVNLFGNSSTKFSDAVGAWGWDEDGDPGTETGRSEAAHWIALNLKSPSRVSIRVARKAGVADPLAIFPGTAAGSVLRPAFTLFAGWDGDGGDEPTFPNRGNVPWAEDLRYLGHVETGGSVAQRTFVLAAGRHTIALGGNSTSLLPEPRQGYEASLVAVSLERPPKYRLRGGGNKVVSKPVLRLTGRIGAPGEITSLRIYHHGKSRVIRVRHGAWAATVTGLSRGRNLLWVTPVSKYGTVFPPQRLVIRRK